MAYPRLIGLVYLENWLIQETGFIKPPFIFEFTISCPRPTVARTRRELVVDETGGEPVSWREKPFADRLIFKEILEGPAALSAAIYPLDAGVIPDISELLNRLAADFGADFLNLRLASLNRLMGVLQSSGLTDFAAGFEQTVAAGSVKLDLLKSDEKISLKMPLISPKAIRNPQPQSRRVSHQTADYLKQAGDSNGFLEFEIELYDR